MGPTRFPYGQAYGFANQFYSNKGVTVGAGLQVAGTAGDISGQTSPDVTVGDLFYVNNTAALTITNFTLLDTANRAGNYEGKVIRVFFLDTATQIANAAPLFLTKTDNLAVGAGGGNSYIELMQSRGTWYETSRSQPNRSEVTNTVMTTASSYNVDGIRVLFLQNTGSITRPVSAFSGGQVGQIIYVMRADSNAMTVQTGGNIIIAGTNSFVLNPSGVYQFIKRNGTTWNMIYQSTAGGIL